jgi:hypothetical protein
MLTNLSINLAYSTCVCVCVKSFCLYVKTNSVVINQQNLPKYFSCNSRIHVPQICCYCILIKVIYISLNLGKKNRLITLFCFRKQSQTQNKQISLLVAWTVAKGVRTVASISPELNQQRHRALLNLALVFLFLRMCLKIGRRMKPLSAKYCAYYHTRS